MRKFSVLLLAFLLVGTFAFGQTLEERVEALENAVQNPAFSFSADGSVTFGVNLDSGATGFENATNAKIRLTLVGNHAREAAGEGAVYGEIRAKGIRVRSVEPNDGESTGLAVRAEFDYAKIVAGPLSVKIAGAPDIDVNFAEALTGAYLPPPESHDGLGGFDELTTFDGRGDQLESEIATSGGVTIDYVVDGAAEIQIGLASVTSWKVAETDQARNDYAFYGQVKVTAIEDMTLTLRAMTGIGLDDLEYPLALGAKFEYSLPINGFTLVPMLAVDVVKAAGSDDFVIEIGNGVRFQWAGRQEFEAPHGWGGDDDETFSGLTVGYTVLLPAGDADPVIGLNAAIVEDEPGGLVDGLGFIFSMGIDDLLADGDPQLGLATQVSYKVDNITPYARLAMVPSAEETTLWAGLKIADIFPKTGLEFAYQSGNLNADDQLGVFRTIVKVTY